MPEETLDRIITAPLAELPSLETDALTERGLDLPRLARETEARLKAITPAATQLSNPVDAGGATDPHPRYFPLCSQPILGDPAVDASLIVGWATGGLHQDSDQVRCTLVVDGQGKVVGGAVSHLVRSEVTAKYWGLPPDVGFRAIGPVTDETRIVVVYTSGAMRWLPARVSDIGDE